MKMFVFLSYPKPAIFRYKNVSLILICTTFQVVRCSMLRGFVELEIQNIKFKSIDIKSVL